MGRFPHEMLGVTTDEQDCCREVSVPKFIPACGNHSIRIPDSAYPEVSFMNERNVVVIVIILVALVLIGVLFLPGILTQPPSASVMSRNQTSLDDPCQRYEQPGGFSSLRKESVDQLIEPLVRNGTYIGVAVAVIDENGYDVWGYGETRLNNSVTPDEDTVFEIGSISKTFNGVLLADSVISGNMTLTAPISFYLPEGYLIPSYKGRNITALDLATHTSGLPAVPADFTEGAEANLLAGKPASEVYEDVISHYQTYSREETYRWLGRYNLTGPIGTSWNYSNLGAAVLGDSIARANGRTYRDLVRERITGPLLMNSTDTVMTQALSARAATGYRTYGGPLAEARKIEFSDFWDPNGGIYSTPHDMVRYAVAGMDLCPTPLSRSFVVAESPFAIRAEQPFLFYQGLQWEVMPLSDGTEIIMKSGETNAFQAQIAFSRQHKKGIIIFTNTANVGEGPHVVSPALHLFMEMIPNATPVSPGG